MLDYAAVCFEHMGRRDEGPTMDAARARAVIDRTLYPSEAVLAFGTAIDTNSLTLKLPGSSDKCWIAVTEFRYVEVHEASGHVHIYEDHIRRLTMENQALRAKLERSSGVTVLTPRTEDADFDRPQAQLIVSERESELPKARAAGPDRAGTGGRACLRFEWQGVL
ncbi:hypothetical protein ACFZBU_36575 [Embleya sp. NPDC008237]|uniref:hypothetical protein n=1 Tax=Embleya sp. NPDC008237 TaxID=3363978 RepID=UPI0036E6017F